MTDYLTVSDIIEIHQTLINRYGGTDGIRDKGALEAAIFRPQTGYYENTTHEAAALMESLALNHPFLDGNKRVAFAAMFVFLDINGYCFTCKPDKAYRFIINLFEAKTFTLEKLYHWLNDNVTRKKD